MLGVEEQHAEASHGPSTVSQEANIEESIAVAMRKLANFYTPKSVAIAPKISYGRIKKTTRKKNSKAKKEMSLLKKRKGHLGKKKTQQKIKMKKIKSCSV